MRFWPRSLQGQVLLALALALLVAQALGAALLHRAQSERREAALAASAAFRLAGAERERFRGWDRPGPRRRMRLELSAATPLRPGEPRNASAERAISAILADEGVAFDRIRVAERAIADDPRGVRWLARQQRRAAFGRGPAWRERGAPSRLLLTAIRRPDGKWLSARVPIPNRERPLIGSLLAQTLLIYLVLVGAVAVILRRITRPLAALTARVERFGERRGAAAPLIPSGPEDVRRLIAAQAAMEGRIAALLDEKDVMLGAIGHDLKTPLSALRVRIESVEDEVERARMARGIEDINRTLDDILSLARVGRPSDPLEPTELAALAASIAEEYEDLGKPVTIITSERIVLSSRATWLRRALRNLIDNALRYGERARLHLTRDGAFAIVKVEDDGPGIPLDQIARMLEPFTRLEASRNTGTGGAGLGLTLARAIAEQHGGTLELANSDRGAGLVATLRLPLR